MEEQKINTQAITTDFEAIINTCESCTGEQAEATYQAFELATQLYENKTNNLGEPYIEQAIDVARIVVQQMALGATSVICALLYRAVKEEFTTLDSIRKLFGNTVHTVMEGLLKLTAIDTTKLRLKTKDNIQGTKNKEDIVKKEIRQTENFISLMLTLTSDVRPVLLRLAFRLHLMRQLAELPPEQQVAIAQETWKTFSPVAHRLGIYNVKTELEDLSMKYTEPKIYRHIAQKLQETKKEREKFIAAFIAPIKVTLDQENYSYEIKGRPKSIFSIWKKMQRQQVPFEGIYDLFAIRIVLKNNYSTKKIIEPENQQKDKKETNAETKRGKRSGKTNDKASTSKNTEKTVSETNENGKKEIVEINSRKEKADCWNVYSLVTELYTPNPKRLRDWISKPKKPSNYESLHTTVMSSSGKWVEVQIRTERMDQIAEKGQAAHWKYKGGKNSDDQWLSKMREMLENKEIETLDKISEEKRELYSPSEIFIFTPDKELKKMPAKSTVLDFAFKIHTKVGEQCSGAVANNVFVPINHELKNGDKVKIVTNKNQTPSQNWLNIVTTDRARSKIKRALKEESYKNARIGKEILQKKFDQWGYPPDLNIVNKVLDYLKLSNSYELYQELGSNRLDPKKLRNILTVIDEEKEAKETESTPPPKPENEKTETKQKPPQQGNYLIIDNEIDKINFQMAKCCNPIPGDDIFGFVTVSKGTRIHRSNCPNAVDLKKRYPYRIVKAKWNEIEVSTAAKIKLQITGYDRMGLVNDVTRIITEEMRINMEAFNISSKNNEFKGEIMVYIKDKEKLKSLLYRLRTVKGIEKAKRI